MTERSQLVSSGRVVAGAFLATGIVLASYLVAIFVLVVLVSNGGWLDAYAVFLGAPLPGLAVAAFMLQQRGKLRTLMGLAIGALVTIALLAMLVGHLASGFNIGF